MTSRTVARRASSDHRIAPEQAPDGGELDEELEHAADQHAPGQRRGELGLGGVVDEQRGGDDGRDLGRVPHHRRHVGEEEPAVAVEDAEAPGRQHEEADAGGDDPDEVDGELELGRRRSRGRGAW